MIKALQKKFIVAAMTAITVLIVVMLAAINITNAVTVNHQINERLEQLSRFGGRSDGMPPSPEDGDFGNDPDGNRIFGRHKEDEEVFMSSTFFVVRYDANMQAVSVDTSHISSVSEEEARTLADAVLESGSTSGKNGPYRYLVTAAPEVNGTDIVFLDTADERYSILRVILLSLLVGVIGWLAMLALVIALSRKAILPIAENIERQKQFVTDAGHEIKTPLAIIQSNTEAMELYNGETKWSRNIKAQVARLSELTKNLLTLARMDESGANAVPVDFDLSRLVQENLQTFAGSLEMKRIRVESEIAPDVTLHADEQQIAQLLSILFDNAVKYTNEGGSFRVQLKKTDRKITLRAENTCTSLPDAPPEKLFDRFYRSDAARTQKSGSFGIGLSSARSITSANKGAIRAEYTEATAHGDGSALPKIAFIITF